MTRAPATSSTLIVLDSDHPTTLREYRSITTARYNQPSMVLMYVMSETQARFGPLVRKHPPNRFGDTGYRCLLRVVTLYLRLLFTVMPASLIKWRTRYLPIVNPLLRNWCIRRRLP